MELGGSNKATNQGCRAANHGSRMGCGVNEVGKEAEEEDETRSDRAVDYKGRPACKASTGGWRAALLILCMEICERLATLGIGLSLVTYLHDEMHMAIPKSANIVTNFLGTSFLACILGGFLADSYLGRYCTIALGSCIQLLGIVLMTVSASAEGLKPPPCEVMKEGSGVKVCEAANGEQTAVLYMALYLMALGTGGIKSSVSGLGADQFEDIMITEEGEGEEEEEDMKGRSRLNASMQAAAERQASFFNWFAFGITVGAMLSVTVMVWLQDKLGRGVGYAACAASMLVALALFVGARPWFRFKPPQGSPLLHVAHVLAAAWRNRRLPAPPDPSLLYHPPGHNVHLIHPDSVAFDLTPQFPPPQDDPAAHAPSSALMMLILPAHDHSKQHQPTPPLPTRYPPVHHTNRFLFLDKAAIVHCQHDFTPYTSPWRLCSLKKVEEVKKFLSLFPILASTIVFWTAVAQMTTFSVEQGATMNRKVWGDFQIPPASLAFFTQVSVLLTVSLYDRMVIPLVRRWSKPGKGITTLQRIGAGLVFSIFAMTSAAIVERKRLHVAHNVQHANNGVVTVLPMSVFYLAPQYMLVGVGEAFSYVGQLDFFYSMSPSGMRSLGTGLCLSTLSLGFFLSSALVSTVNMCTRNGSGQGWLANDLNRGRLDNFYWLLAISNLINLTIYLMCAHWYSHNNNGTIKENEKEVVRDAEAAYG